MYAYLNDYSIAPNGVINPADISVVSIWAKTVEALQSFGITRLRVPQNFAYQSITGGPCLNDYAGVVSLIRSILANLTEEQVEPIPENVFIQVYWNQMASDLVTEAYYSGNPILSFTTHSDFSSSFVKVDLYEITNQSGSQSPLKIMNFHNTNNLSDHEAFLLRKGKENLQIINNWNPIDDPIWNQNTGTILELLDLKKINLGEGQKEAFILKVGSMVAEMNGWVWDEQVSKWNKNSGQLRKIFRSSSGITTAYLSIDVEKPAGEFELFDRKGDYKWPINHMGEKRETSTIHRPIRVR